MAEKIVRRPGTRRVATGRWLIRFARGQRIDAGQAAGAAWRVLRGSVRLDREEPNGEQSFASLAVKGDIIGAKTLLFGRYSFTATALSACVLERWLPGGWPRPSCRLQRG